MDVRIALYGFIGLLFMSVVPFSFAHTTVHVEPYELEAGWSVEPPVVGIRNDLVLKVLERGDNEGVYTGITSAFKNLDATVMFGGASKQIDINSDPRPGYYFSPIIPTKTGTYMVQLDGEINGIPVNVKIPIEDVEPTAVLDFPPSSSAGDSDVAALKNSISSIQQDISELKTGETKITATDEGAAYDFAIFGLSIGAAAIILSIVALVKRK